MYLLNIQMHTHIYIDVFFCEHVHGALHMAVSHSVISESFKGSALNQLKMKWVWDVSAEAACVLTLKRTSDVWCSFESHW